MFKVAVDGRGRFGNNLIQYFAVKIFCKYFTNYKYVLHKNDLSNPITITETQFYKCLENGQQIIALSNADIFLEGFFQDISFLSKHRDFIKTLYTVNNNNIINYHHYEKKMVIKDLIIRIKDEDKPGSHDLVMHLRLDDFIHQGHNSNILDVNYYIEAVVESNCDKKWNTIWIVVDKLNNEFDKKYVDFLLKSLNNHHNIRNIKLHQKSFLEDWTFCIKSTSFISSNSSFALTAILLSDMKYVILPNELVYKNMIPIDKIENCIIREVKRINMI